MAKVLPLSGSPSAELIHAAFGQARAMELGVIPFRKLIQVTNGTFQFRRDADGRVTAFVEEVTSKGYQFFTTGPVVQTVPGTGMDAGVDLYRGYSIKVRLTNGASKAKAIASSLEIAPVEPDKPPRWEFAAASDMGQQFPRKGIWQLHAVPEHQYFAKDPTEKSNTGVATYPMLVDSWSQDTPLANLGDRGSRVTPLRSVIDVTYDVAPSVFKTGEDRPTAGAFEDDPDAQPGQAFAPDSDWMKRAGLVTVEHLVYGKRTFCVLSDISNNFHVYPANAPLNMAQLDAAEATWPEQGIKSAIPPMYVRTVAAPMPAWCRAGTDGAARDILRTAMTAGDTEWNSKYRVSTPQYRWAFNSVCTKACAVVYEDIPGIELGTNPSYPTPYTPLRTATDPIEESLPGLVEMGLHIAITGENPEDFTFSMTLDREMRPTVTKDYIMAADYAWVVKSGGINITELDDLILMKGSIYHTSDDRQLVRSANNVELYLHALKGVVTIRNYTRFTDIRTFLVADTNLPYKGVRTNPANFTPQIHWALPYWEAVGMIVAYDLRILAFVVQQRLIVQDLTTNVGPGYSDRHQGLYKACQRVLVYAHNALAQEKKMDADSPLNARLVEVFEDTDVTGRFLFPVDQVGMYQPGSAVSAGSPDGDGALGGTPGAANHMLTAYRSLGIMAPLWDDYGYGLPAGTDSAKYHYGALQFRWLMSGGSLNAGPFLYAERIAPTLRSGAYEAFTVFADGSWSITTAPFYYYSGGGTDLDNKWPFSITRPQNFNEQIDLNLMKQDMVDIINFRITNPKTGAVRDVRTTHLAMANKALNKTWAKQDFMCEFSFEEKVMPNRIAGRADVMERFMLAETQTPGATDRFLVFRTWGHYNEADPVGSGNPVYLDPRVPYDNHMYASAGPVLRGASLFY